ncbi:MAG TPA: isochorismatase family cysteine hydrolase [Candidatus Nanoarchaeia archaeon]|nr:isochorismatase family cysteine hydrolase [Candidatus Nanoarchaeia archaeon]
MKIPLSRRKKALFIVDVQAAFLNERNKGVVKNISKLLEKVKYDLYVEAIFHAEKSSLWDKQIKWTLPKTDKFSTVAALRELLKDKKRVYVDKTTRSVFKGDKDIFKILQANKIKEVHIVGVQTNSCVLTTALEAFDANFFTYVIEECCESDELGKHQLGVEILREQNLTNNSCVEDIGFLTI